MKKITIYERNTCAYCVAAKHLLDSLKLPYETINVDEIDGGKEALVEKTGWRTVPQIFFDDDLIGGFDELNKLHHSHELLEKLEA